MNAVRLETAGQQSAAVEHAVRLANRLELLAIVECDDPSTAIRDTLGYSDRLPVAAGPVLVNGLDPRPTRRRRQSGAGEARGT